MKFKYKGMIEIVPYPLVPGKYRISNGTKLVLADRVESLSFFKENFTPVDNEALDLVDPNRTKRLCQ